MNILLLLSNVADFIEKFTKLYEDESIRSFLYLGVSSFLALTIVLLFLWRENVRLIKKNQKLEQTVTELNGTVEKQRLLLMSNQMRPHFIFNMLLAIKQLCVENPKQAAEAIQHFARYLRTNIEALSEERLVPFSKELECIKEYIALEQADPASGFQIKYEIQYDEFELPLLTVQPMVENAVRHGIASKRGEGIVKIRTLLEDEKIFILVEDNGTGFGSETRQQAEHRSIGLKNVTERLRILCKGELSIINTGHGTTVQIVIPKDKEK